MIATCGQCDWRLEEPDETDLVLAGAGFAPRRLVEAAYNHVRSAHPDFWDDWQRAIRNGHYLLTGEGLFEP